VQNGYRVMHIVGGKKDLFSNEKKKQQPKAVKEPVKDKSDDPLSKKNRPPDEIPF
jgi:hypothetical protein